MTPEEIQKLLAPFLKRIDELENQIKALNNNATIPFDTGEAIKARVLADVGFLVGSSKSATSENKSVNEAGAATYSVMDKPDGFLEVTILGNLYYLPYFL